jgi:type IV secretion system protein VirB9
VHPAKPGISSNLNLITDKGNIYSFTLQDVSAVGSEPDLKVFVQPVDGSALVASNGPPKFVPADQLSQSQEQVAKLQSRLREEIDKYRSAYPTELKFDYKFKATWVPLYLLSRPPSSARQGRRPR